MSSHEVISAAGAVVELSSETFDEAVGASALPIVIDFWTDWCPPCKALAPIIEAVAVEQAGKLRFAKVNADEHPEIAARFQVMSFPTLLVFDERVLAKRLIGARGRGHLLEELADFLAR
jgi:thioredoxin 1